MIIDVDKILLDDRYVVARIQDCSPNSIKQVCLFGEDLVLWRGSTSESPILAWQDYCPHRGARLSLGKIVGDTLRCQYHGWEYNFAMVARSSCSVRSRFYRLPSMA